MVRKWKSRTVTNPIIFQDQIQKGISVKNVYVSFNFWFTLYHKMLNEIVSKVKKRSAFNSTIFSDIRLGKIITKVPFFLQGKKTPTPFTKDKSDIQHRPVVRVMTHENILGGSSRCELGDQYGTKGQGVRQMQNKSTALLLDLSSEENWSRKEFWHNGTHPVHYSS